MLELYSLLMIALLVSTCLLWQISALSCLDQNGNPVEWWVVFKTPPKTGTNAYGYYDANMKTSELQYHNSHVDVDESPLTHTLNAFNEKVYGRVAWNDEKPSGKISSTSAHSKGMIGFDMTLKNGFFLSHSIPKFPSFNEGKVNPIIGDSQQVFGQHLSCFSMTLSQLDKIASNLLVIKAYIYEALVDNTSNTQNLYLLGNSKVKSQVELFTTDNMRSAVGYGLISIYKNYKINGSIFEDGLTQMLAVSPMKAETWGRPLSQAWCSDTYNVNNVLTIRVGEVEWHESLDHSKWVIAGNDYACFGDMNRMDSQWKRGGAFYCLTETTLIAAMQKIVIDHDLCILSPVKQLQTE